jgi:signal peptidase I
MSFLIDLLQTLILAVILYFLIDAAIARVRVENVSMQPTLVQGEFILVNKLAYKLGGDVQRGDIIVFHYPGNPAEDYIKRIVGIPGDHIQIGGGKVLINNQQAIEPYIASPPNYTGEWDVPEGHVFVLGDNRNSSSDSHSWGFVPKEYIVGRALAIYWPLDKFKILSEPLTVQAAAEP